MRACVRCLAACGDNGPAAGSTYWHWRARRQSSGAQAQCLLALETSPWNLGGCAGCALHSAATLDGAFDGPFGPFDGPGRPPRACSACRACCAGDSESDMNIAYRICLLAPRAAPFDLPLERASRARLLPMQGSHKPSMPYMPSTATESRSVQLGAGAAPSQGLKLA